MNTLEEAQKGELEMERSMGIFQIQNKVNQKIYIGCSDNLEAAWESHKFRLDSGIHPNGPLQSDYHKMGPDNFVFEIIRQISNEKAISPEVETELNNLETTVLNELQPYDEKGYNKQHA